jgi:hypothetical protein
MVSINGGEKKLLKQINEQPKNGFHFMVFK